MCNLIDDSRAATFEMGFFKFRDKPTYKHIFLNKGHFNQFTLVHFNLKLNLFISSNSAQTLTF